MRSSESPEIATLVLRVTAVTCSPRTCVNRSRLRTYTGTSTTASVTRTAAALIPAILIRNGIPVAARSDDAVMDGVVIRWTWERQARLTHSTRNGREALLSDQVLQVAHVE